MQQRNDSLLSVEPTNLLNLPDDVLCHEVLPNLDVNSLVALERVNHRIKALLPKVWEAKHALYFPRANQETVKWLLERGVTWFNIFMNDYQNQREFRQFERNFKGSKINEVIDCLLRKDCDGLMLLNVDWREFYSWMTTPLNSSLQISQPTDAYFIILIGNSSNEIRQYIYQNLKKVYEKEILFSPTRTHMEWLVKLVCRQPLQLTDDECVNDFEKTIKVNDHWNMTLIELAIVSRNVKVVSQVFQWSMSLDNSKRLDILNSGLKLITEIGFYGLSMGEAAEYVQWFERFIGLDHESSIQALSDWMYYIGKYSDIEWVIKFAEMYLNGIDRSTQDDDSIVSSIYPGFYRNPVKFLAFCQRHAINVSANKLSSISKYFFKSGLYEFSEYMLQQKLEAPHLESEEIRKLFCDACVDINKLKFLSLYSSFDRDWVGRELIDEFSCTFLLHEFAKLPIVNISPENVFYCVLSLLESNDDNRINYKVMFSVIFIFSNYYKVNKDAVYLAFLEALNEYWFDVRAEHYQFLEMLLSCVKHDRFGSMCELVFMATDISPKDFFDWINQLSLPKQAPSLALSDDNTPVQFMDEVCHAAREAVEENPEREDEIKEALTLLTNQDASPDMRVDNDKLTEVSSAFMQDPSPSMRALGIAMMVAGTLLTIAGALIIAASMFAAVTGVLGVLAAPGMTVGIPLAVTGTAIALAGFGMFSGKQAELSEMSSEQQLGFSL